MTAAILFVQMCLSFNGALLCSTLEAVEFKTVDDCARAAELVSKHSGRAVRVTCRRGFFLQEKIDD